MIPVKFKSLDSVDVLYDEMIKNISKKNAAMMDNIDQWCRKELDRSLEYIIKADYEELENIRSYIQIQQVRYPGRFDVFYHIDDSLLDCRTLKLILQPLVENSILHNIEHRDYLSIDISGKLSEDLIILCVKDNGTGMTKEQMEQILKPKTHAEKGYVFSGLGVCNVEERIRLAYGPDYGLEYNSDGYSYTEVTITFPRHQKSDPLLQKEAKQ